MSKRKLEKPQRMTFGIPEEKKQKGHGKSPVRGYRQVVLDSGNPGYINRVLVATPTTGNVRIEWVAARYGQLIPPNWSQVTMNQYMNSFIAERYSVPDAQNMIVKEVVEKDFEWLILIEHDNVLPYDCFVRFNDYINKETHPVVSGLYYTKERPSQPLVYRGRGTSYYDKFKIGDVVEVDGVPTGCLLIHGGLLRAMWNESPEYSVNGVITRRVFDQPMKMWQDPEQIMFNIVGGTSDLEWCTRVMEGGYFKKAGWDEFADKQYPFIVDTNIFCKHIDTNGIMYP